MLISCGKFDTTTDPAIDKLIAQVLPLNEPHLLWNGIVIIHFQLSSDSIKEAVAKFFEEKNFHNQTITKFKILKIQETTDRETSAVLVDTNSGKKIILLKKPYRPTDYWLGLIYDANSLTLQ